MEDLQSLLEKINREGVEKADAEAKRIIDEAKAKADAIVKAARDEAAAAKAEAEKNAADYAARAAETIKQSARDVIIGIKDAVAALLEKVLVKGVDQALADEATVSKLVATAIGELTGSGEIVCAPQVAASVKAALAGNPALTVTTDENMGSGFSVKTDGGRVEHTFTGEAIAAELAKRLRPDLAKLVQ